MGKKLKKTILLLAIFSFALVGGAWAETDTENNENDYEEIRERIEELREDVEELMELARERGIEVEEEKEECEPYLEGYIKFGVQNNPEEVEKLQTFLNENEGADLPVTGFYGEKTLEAVKEFQAKYADEILSPWGIQEPTGFVYKTTQTLINDIKCPGVSISPPEELSPATPEIMRAEVLGEEDVRDEHLPEERDEEAEEVAVTVEEDIEDEDPQQDEVDEIEGEVDEEEEEVIREEEREGDTTAWIALIIGAIGLGIVVYNIATFNKGKEKKV